MICPHCKKTVEISEVLRHQFNEKELEKINDKHQAELEMAKKEALASAALKIEEQFKLQIKMTKDDLLEKDKRNKELIEQITQISKSLRLAQKEKDEAELEMEKKLAIEEKKIRLDAQKKAEEEQRDKILAKDKQLQDTLKELEDAKRKLEQGSQQTQGEVFELEFEKILQTEFPHDKISSVAKGVRGGDVIQEVWDSRGNYNGKILWEMKNTRAWSEGWVDKLKADKREIGAEEAVLVTDIIPKEIKTAGFRKGIWVSQRNFAIGLASALRAGLIQLYYVKNAATGKDAKVEMIYSYLSGVEFKHRIEAIIEAFTNMQVEIEKEQRYFQNKWARDSRNLRQVIDNTYGMHGDLKSIVGNKLPEISGLEEQNQQNLLED